MAPKIYLPLPIPVPAQSAGTEWFSIAVLSTAMEKMLISAFSVPRAKRAVHFTYSAPKQSSDHQLD